MSTLVAWPAEAVIQRLDLRLARVQQSATSPLNGRQMRGASRSDLWMGSAVIAPRERTDLEAIAAFVENLQGRHRPFLLPLQTDFVTFAGPSDGVLASTATAGAASISVTFASTGQTLKKGTLVQVGRVGAKEMQVLEVAADVTTAAPATVTFTSRLHYSPAAGVHVLTAGAQLRVRLVQDEGAPATYGIGYGAVTVPFIEVPGFNPNDAAGLVEEHAGIALAFTDQSAVIVQ